ncbi:MAG TPA: PBP1A family penicillin-binding protein [Candidatus Moranbacteria bacterium]|nr:PBP1A family penicillin-binding protein [Candidatus Moranbacteria bacterium]
MYLKKLAKKKKQDIKKHFKKIQKNNFFSVRTFLLGIFYFFMAVIFSGLLFIIFAYFFIAPGVKELPNRMAKGTTVIYDRTGEHILYEIYGEENRKILSHDQIPNSIRVATIVAEDASFYEHPGVDIPSILRALEINIRRSKFQQGGSTITQQLARNVFLSRDKTLKRKFLETIIAIKLENNFSKDEILDFYLNQIPYGSNAYGIQSASQTFFGKDAINLTLDEAALLAALPKATTLYSPYGNNKDALVSRQKSILSEIEKIGVADKEIIKEAFEENTLNKIFPPRKNIEAPHFVFYVKEMLEKEYGALSLETEGLKIYTTLDYDMQKRAEESVREGAVRNEKYRASNASLVAINPKNGEVLAMVGSKDFFDSSIDGQVNIATSLRQPGSSFKPFAYARAFEKGYQPETLLFDVPTNFGPDGSGKDYMPNNYDGTSHGLVSMRQALSMSLNIPAVETLYLAGINETIDLAEKLGISTLNNRNRFGLSLVLGGGEVKLLDMVSAFSVFANDGIKNPPSTILKIVDQKGNVIRENSNHNERVIYEQIARKISSVLSDNASRSAVFGSSSPLAFKDREVAAKTGTTQEFRDAWTIGYTPSIAVGVWVGNNNNIPMKSGSDGIYVAAPIWRNFLDKELMFYPDEKFGLYEKVESSKPMITGKASGEVRYYKIASGKKISENKAKKYKASEVRSQIEPDRHSILFYVNKNAPLGPEEPDYTDPMFARWEEALGQDFENTLFNGEPAQ